MHPASVLPRTSLRSGRRRSRQSLPSIPLFRVSNVCKSEGDENNGEWNEPVRDNLSNFNAAPQVGEEGGLVAPPLSHASCPAACSSASSNATVDTLLSIPPIGVGTYELRGEACVRAVCTALKMGFRLLDTAAAYRNEALVGEGIRQSGVPREELFVNVKIAMKTMGSEEKLRAGVLQSIDLLGIGYADAVLVHWPGCGGLKPEDAAGHSAARRRCWTVMHALQREGKVRALGVSNYLPRHFSELREMPWASAWFEGEEKQKHGYSGHHGDKAASATSHQEAMQPQKDPTTPSITPSAGIPCLPTTTTTPERVHPSDKEKCELRYDHGLPVLNQIELHPLCVQQETVDYCRSHGMQLQQYSPLGKADPRLLQHPTLLALHETNFAPAGYTVSDMLLLWGLLHGFIPLVRSGNEAHLRANWALAADFFGLASDTSDVSETRNSTRYHVEATELEKGVTRDETTDLPCSGSSSPSERQPRPPLTNAQREVLLHLRQHLGITEDEHLCWNSVTIA